MAANWIGSYWNNKMEGSVEVQLALMNDEDESVAKAAYKKSEDTDDKRIMEALKEALEDPGKADLHYYCLESLLGKWFDYSEHKKTNKEAYKITMYYFKKKPRTEKVPVWMGLSNLKIISDSNFGDWKKKAKYYNPKEIVDIMRDIIKDADTDYLCRISAIEVIGKHGGKKAIKDLKPLMKKLKDDRAGAFNKDYDRIAKDYK